MKYKNQSPFTSIIGGAGVTVGEKQLTSGSGVGIYQGFTQETSQLLKKYKNYSHLTRLASALQPNIRFLWSISASCDPSYNTLATKIYHYLQRTKPNFEKIDPGRRPGSIFSKFGLKKYLSPKMNSESDHPRNKKTSK